MGWVRAGLSDRSHPGFLLFVGSTVQISHDGLPLDAKRWLARVRAGVRGPVSASISAAIEQYENFWSRVKRNLYLATDLILPSDAYLRSVHGGRRRCSRCGRPSGGLGDPHNHWPRQCESQSAHAAEQKRDNRQCRQRPRQPQPRRQQRSGETVAKKYRAIRDQSVEHGERRRFQREGHDRSERTQPWEPPKCGNNRARTEVLRQSTQIAGERKADTYQDRT